MERLSKSAIHYRKNRASRNKKKAYDTKYHKTPTRKRYRANLNRERRRRNLKGDSRDLSHTKSGKLVLESKKLNRARNGSGNKSSLK